jgi:tetratricopeptide (TPR) repeat protein
MSPRNGRIAIAAMAALLAGPAFGQGRGGSAAPPAAGAGSVPGGNTGGRTPTTPSTFPNPTTNPNNPNNPNNSTPSMPRPIFLSGRVVADDGSPLPEAATIVRVCGANSHNEGYTDSSGHFSIQLFNETAVLQDASQENGYGSMGGSDTGFGNSRMGSQGSQGSSGMMDRRLYNCELKANLSGFRSQSVQLAAIQPMNGPNDIGTIFLHRTGKGEEGNTVSATSLAAPKDARKAFQKGMELLRKQKVEDAFREYQKAVALYPTYATAWCELGKIQESNQQLDIARGSFNQAIKSDPKYMEPYLELSRMALNAKNWPELAELTGKAIALDSFDYPQAFLFDAVAHYNLHEFDPAEKSIKRAEMLDSRHNFPQILYLKGLVQVQHQDYAGAAESLRAYLKVSPNAEDAAHVREQLSHLDQYASQAAAKKQQAE